MTDVSWPWKRRELAILLKETANSNGHNQSDFDIDYIFHFLFDDTDLASDPRSQIGIILKKDDEAQNIALLCSALDKMLERIGDAGSEMFLNDLG